MADEQSKTLEGLKTAIQMEIDGKEFYTKASAGSGNDLGKKLLATLAEEEDIHRMVFIGIYEAIRGKKEWPQIDFRSDGGEGLRTVFAKATAGAGPRIQSKTGELEDAKTAREMEGKTYDYYQSQLKKATSPAEKELYERLSAQEHQHSLILTEYIEYLQNPEGWFVKKEHPHLD